MNTIESGRNEWKYYLKGPLNEVTEAVKCNYVIYWSGDHGMGPSGQVDPLRAKSMMETKKH